MHRPWLLLFFFAASLSAAPAPLRIEKLAGTPIVLDGDLSDAAWQQAIRIDDFYEYFRGDNTKPPVRTTAYLAYDAEALYVAFAAEDPAPKQLRAPFVDRDQVQSDQDYVSILIDTQNDRRSGVELRVNPRGVQSDSVYNDADATEDFSPDFFFESVALPTPSGWQAELRIPLSSLRYPNREAQTWGVMLMRNYPREFRYVVANAPVPKNSGCFVCHASALTGFDDLPTGTQHLTLVPYTTVQNEWRYSGGGVSAPRGSRSQFGNDVGLDLKWTPSSKLKIDGTLNPDFSQIESDVPQLASDPRFALSYPEKRAFFLEGVDLLATPIRAVYTRSITSPAWGMRATGNAGATAYTLLVAEDRGGGSMLLPGHQGTEFAAQDFRSRVLIGRARRSLGDHFAALLVSARELDGGGHNRLIGPDFLWKVNETDRVVGQLLFSDTVNPDRPELSPQFDGRSSTGNGLRILFTRDAERYDIWSVLLNYSPEFRADNGFVAQNDVRKGVFEIGLRRYPKKFFTYLRPHLGFQYDQRNTTGEKLFSRAYQTVYFQGRWGSAGWLSLVEDQQRVGNRLLGYKWVDFNVEAAPRRWFPTLGLGFKAGEKVDYANARVGTGAIVNLNVSLRPTDRLETELRTSREWLEAGGRRQFTTDVDWLKLTYTFTVRSMVRVIGERIAEERRGTLDRNLGLSALYAYKVNFQTLVYLGYGDARITGEEQRMVPDRKSVFMKVSYAWQR
ncbi:MAG TPA: DUF5916 domain-containing protein [Thermoanaerobaculia bacterium]